MNKIANNASINYIHQKLPIETPCHLSERLCPPRPRVLTSSSPTLLPTSSTVWFTSVMRLFPRANSMLSSVSASTKLSTESSNLKVEKTR